MRISLRTKITGLFLAVILGLGATVFLAFNILTRGQIDRTVRHDVESATHLLDRLLHDRASYLLGQTKLIADLPTIKMALTESRDPATMSDRAEFYLPSLQADGVMFTDRDGIRLGGTDMTRDLPKDMSNEPAIAQALEKNQSWWGIRVLNGKLMLATTVPIVVGGYAHGTMTAYSEIGADTARQLKDGLSADVAFVVGPKISASTLDLKSPIDVRDGGPSDIRVHNDEYVAVRASLPGASAGEDAHILVMRNRSDLAESYSKFSFAFLCVLFISLVVAVAAAGRIAGQITRPLGGIVSAAETLRAGEWPERFETSGQDEIGILQGAFNDMTTALQESQRKLLSMIDSDPLTELDNHRRFKETLDLETARCQASGQPLSLILINLDRFGLYNEARGHGAGDALLRTVADILRAVSPAVAQLARQSGDGFSVTLPLTDIEGASRVAEDLRSAIAGVDGITVSCGCAEASAGTVGSSKLILAAEIALERAKQLGRNQVSRFDTVAGAEGTTDPHELNDYLQDASLATIQALAAAVDAKDHYTRGHSQRVAEYASSLCRYIGGSEAEIELTSRTGTLHDVGKIGVPDSILNKQGRLTDAERAIIETHAVIGELIVRKVPQLEATLSGVRNHHEHWDGNGYPDKLRGTETSRLARTLAVADAFDAMTSDRPYRKGMPVEVALQEIVRAAGTQFDPYLAISFAKMMWERYGIPAAA